MMTKCVFCPELGVATTLTTTTSSEAFPFLCTQLGVNVSPSSKTGSLDGGGSSAAGGSPPALCSSCHSLWEEVSVLYSNMQGLVNLMTRRVQQFKKNMDKGHWEQESVPGARKRKPKSPPDDESIISWWYPHPLSSASAMGRKRKKTPEVDAEDDIEPIGVFRVPVFDEVEIKSELEDDDVVVELGVVGSGRDGDQEMGIEEDFEILPEDDDDEGEDDKRADPSYDPQAATSNNATSRCKKRKRPTEPDPDEKDDLEEEEAVMNLDKATKYEESQLAFMLMLKDFPSLLNKSQLPAVKEAKAKSVQAFIKKWKGLTGDTFRKQALMKKINNSKARLKLKTESQVGNKKIVLLKWEQVFLDILQANDDPKFAKIRGAISSTRSSARASVTLLGLGEDLEQAIIPPVKAKAKVSSETAKSVPTTPPPPPVRKRKADDIVKESETEETLQLSNQQLQRLVMLEQLKSLR